MDLANSTDLLLYGADIVTERGKISQVFCFESYLTKEECVTLILDHYPNGTVIEDLMPLGETLLLKKPVGEVTMFIEQLESQYHVIMKANKPSKADELRDLLNKMDLALHETVLSETAIRESRLAQELYEQIMEAKNQANGSSSLAS
ncbi:hypothetical protein I6N95_02700 [Vagococcus sp. BWB3-3]|uniref:Uncharacterized protein n=1 Tax=Vagococcus allomyrinae TaxID=2794353 RepID=A0A940SV24_9ENTE|nr:hypothetical protein [Vagococcus allomyrinae]MBP1039913.1 hypothetical protein [Vagococcus allomyrinae]